MWEDINAKETIIDIQKNKALVLMVQKKHFLLSLTLLSRLNLV